MKILKKQSPISRIKYREEINGLRAIAVISVVFYHAGYSSFSGGWLGVDVFFVVSGYLISNIILSELNDTTFSFKNFYLRRIRRILPALFSTLLISLPFSYWLLTPKGMLEYIESAFASIFFYANYFFQNLDFYNAEPSKYMPLLHTWSLAVEEQFYLIFPLLCFLVYKFFKNYTFIFFGVIFVVSIFLNSTTGDLVKFYQLQFRAWELVFGALVMILNHKFSIKNVEKIGIILILFSIFYFDNSMITINSLEPKLLVNTGTALVLVSKSDTGFVFKSLTNKFSNFFGKISYSLYLFHQPFYAFVLLFEKKYSHNFSNFTNYLLLVLLVLLSFLNWKFIELKYLTNSFKKLTLFLLPSLILILSFIFLGKQSNGFEDRYSYVPERVLFYSVNTNLFSTQEDVDAFNSFCEDKKEKNLFIIGDSHVTNLSYTLITEYPSLSCEYNLTIYGTSAGRCLLSGQSDIVGYVGWCSEESLNNLIAKLSNEESLVILFGRFDTWLDVNKGGQEVKCDNCDFLEIVRNRFKKIINSSNQIIILSPVPTYEVNIAESYLYKKYKWGEEITLDMSEWTDYISQTKEFLKEVSNENTDLINTEEIFCNGTQNKCYASKNSEIYYTDSNHLSLEGSRLVIDKIFQIEK
tara:strand:+ start:8140 stop:10050 length:1911 start_codon:yes stop_codon:yes gene_type:complete